MTPILLLLLLLLSAAGCSGMNARVKTFDKPTGSGLVYTQRDGYMCVFDSVTRNMNEVEFSLKAYERIAKLALVGAMVSYWLNADGLAEYVNIRSRPHFEPIILGPGCKPARSLPPAPVNPIQQSILREANP